MKQKKPMNVFMWVVMVWAVLVILAGVLTVILGGAVHGLGNIAIGGIVLYVINYFKNKRIAANQGETK